VGPNDKQAGKKKIKCERVTLFYTSNDDGRKNLILEDTIVTCRKESQLSMIGGFITLL
jgi:hypothetical protein